MRWSLLAALVLFPVVAHAGFPFGPGGSNGEFTAGNSSALESLLSGVNEGDWLETPNAALSPTLYTSGWTVDGAAWKRTIDGRPVRVTLTTSDASSCNTPPTLTNLVAVADDSTNPGAGNYSYHPGTNELYIGSNPTGLYAYVGGPGVVKEEACIITYNNPSSLRNIWGQIGLRCIVEAWSSAAYDASANRFFATSGGHNCYGGNEVYEFDFDLMQWSRLTEPSPVTVSDGQSLVPENGPPSFHMYDGMHWFNNEIWVTNTNVGFWGDAANVPAPTDPWTFNPSTLTWTKETTYTDAADVIAGYADYGFYTINPATGNLFGCAGGTAPNHCFEIDSSGVMDETPTDQQPWNSSSGNGMLKSSDTEMWLFKHESITKVEFDGVTTTVTVVESSLPAELVSHSIGDAGIDWVSSRGEFIIWPGQGNIWGYEPATRTFRKYGVSTGDVPNNNVNYLYEQFYYIPGTTGSFFAHANVAEGVWLYKVPAKVAAVETITP